MRRSTRTALVGSAFALCATAAFGTGPALAHSNSSASGPGGERTVRLEAQLSELNGSGASGTASAVVRNQRIQHIEVHASGLTPDAPHAQHIHYGDDARNECPTADLDTNRDGRINTVEGIPAYGPVVVSLNTTGDTTPASFLEVGRFPVAREGELDYSRDDIRFTRVDGTGYQGGGGTAKQIAEAIRDGEGVVVIHGLDYDGNGTYNFSDPEGASELGGGLPAEATDPAVCGVLR